MAVLASDPFVYGGSWTADAADKVARFVDLADTFHLPVVHLVDNPGFLIGTDAEKQATIRHGVRALAAIYQAEVPWCSVHAAQGLRRGRRRARGPHPQLQLPLRLAVAATGARCRSKGGIEAAYRGRARDRAPTPTALVAEIAAPALTTVRSPFRTAEAFDIEEIIDPRDTRPLLCEFAHLAAPLRRPGRRGRAMRP